MGSLSRTVSRSQPKRNFTTVNKYRRRRQMRKIIYQQGKKVLAFLMKTFIFVAPFMTIATALFPQDKRERSEKQNGFHSSTWLYPH
jgi:hypothetical protein